MMECNQRTQYSEAEDDMKKFLKLAFSTIALAIAGPANAETTNCTEITSLPFTITAQGIYCLKQNLNVNLATGNAITINAGNVTVDFNGFRVNNQAALATNEANGVYANQRKNITLRNGFIRGFYYGVLIDETVANTSAGHLIEAMKVADCGFVGIQVEGAQSVVHDNRVNAIGGGGFISSFGIVLREGDDGIISNNIVSEISETDQDYSIYIAYSNRVQIERNIISDISGGSLFNNGISLFNTSHANVAGNRLLNNPASGTGGIVDLGSTSTNVSCLNNDIGGFGPTPLTGCDETDGNRVLFD